MVAKLHSFSASYYSFFATLKKGMQSMQRICDHDF